VFVKSTHVGEGANAFYTVRILPASLYDLHLTYEPRCLLGAGPSSQAIVTSPNHLFAILSDGLDGSLAQFKKVSPKILAGILRQIIGTNKTPDNRLGRRFQQLRHKEGVGEADREKLQWVKVGPSQLDRQSNRR
jgi:hypothetical protein